MRQRRGTFPSCEICKWCIPKTTGTLLPSSAVANVPVSSTQRFKTAGSVFAAIVLGGMGLAETLAVSPTMPGGHGQTVRCPGAGGALSNAVYELQSSPNSSAVLQRREKIVVGEVGDSCTESCRKANGAFEHFECLDSLLPILLRINQNGKSVLHTELSCNKVLKGDKTHLRNVAPGMMVGGTDACYTTIGRHLMCTSKRSGFQRVCACGQRS